MAEAAFEETLSRWEDMLAEGRIEALWEEVGDPRQAPRTLDPVARARWHRVAGLAALRDGRSAEARDRLEQAWAMDPLNREVTAALGQLRVADGDEEGAYACFAALWMHHADSLTPTSRSLTAFRVAERARAEGDLDLTRVLLDRAFADTPENSGVGLTLLEVLEEQGNEVRAAEVRARLLRLVQEPATRAKLAMDQARELRDREEHARAALLMAEAYRLQPDEGVREEVEPWLREGQAWGALADVLETHARALEDAAERLSRAEELVRLHGEHLGDALELGWRLDRHLDAHPGDLKVFEWQTITLGNAELWEELHNAYARMIQRTHNREDADERLLAVLWRNLAMLLETELNQPTQALHAYRMAYQHGREDAVQDAILRLVERVGEKELPLAELEKATLAHPQRPDLAERYGAALLKGGETDRGYLVLRAAVARGGASRNAEQAVNRLSARRPEQVTVRVPDDLRREYLRPVRAFAPLESLFRIAGTLMADRLHHDADSFGLRRSDRLEDGELLVIRTLEQLREPFGLEQTPAVYVREGLPGVVNPYFQQPTLLVSPELLRGVNAREMRFVLARALHLMRPEFALTTRLMPPQLHTVLAGLLLAVLPEAPVQETAEAEGLRSDLDGKLDPAMREALRLAAESIVESGVGHQLDRWLVSVADEANRVGLLYADDVVAALDGLERLTPAHARTGLANRREALLAWAASAAYHHLRDGLGITLRNGDGG
ncbi:MAG: hypothetical protein EA398_00280 [Deltaproteobacteria bacterium]|nr:MAG: hypothetical protein EA398_00280 [Deltaproteobacteria bacterium]